MARTKSSARKQRSAPRDVQAAGEKVSKQKKKLAKSKLKAKAKARHETKVQAVKTKQARKLEALTAEQTEGSSGQSDEDGEDEDFIEIDSQEPSSGRGGRASNARDVIALGNEEDGEEEDDSSRLMHETMPWMGDKKGYFNENLYMCLHNEIMDFVRFMSPTRDELLARSQLIDLMRDLVASIWEDATMDTFGSHRTQMFLPNSDIDMVIFGVPNGTKPLFEFAKRLEELDMVSYLEVIDKARIPIVKFVHKESNIHVDVSFNISGGLATADLVRHYMRVYPAFRPLTLVMKYFLAQRGLNETFAGGIGSFLLQLMVVSFLQHHRRSLGADHDDPKHNNLGQLLVAFLTLYGRDWNYDDLGISVRSGGQYFFKEDREWYDGGRPFLLSMENPNDPSLDVAKNSYEIRTVKRSFEYARQVLENEIHRRGQFHPLAGSILGTIIPADSHLLDRVGPDSLGYAILHHDPEKTAAVRKQYEARRDEETRKKAAEAASKREAKNHRRQNVANDPPHKRWKGRDTRSF